MLKWSLTLCPQATSFEGGCIMAFAKKWIQMRPHDMLGLISQPIIYMYQKKMDGSHEVLQILHEKTQRINLTSTEREGSDQSVHCLGITSMNIFFMFVYIELIFTDCLNAWFCGAVMVVLDKSYIILRQIQCLNTC